MPASPAGTSKQKIIVGKRQRNLERNIAICAGLSKVLLADFLCYLRCRFGHEAEYQVNGTTPAVIAAYVSSPNLGKWAALWRNKRHRRYGYMSGPVDRQKIPSEEISTMMNRVTLDARQRPDVDEASIRFAEASRSAAFLLSFGIREIRLLASQPWERSSWLQPSNLDTLRRLVDKGLVVHEIGEPPRLSKAGKLVRKLMVLSRHIVEA